MYRVLHVDPNDPKLISQLDGLASIGIGDFNESLVSVLNYGIIKQRDGLPSLVDLSLEIVVPPDRTYIVISDASNFDVIAAIAILQLRLLGYESDSLRNRVSAAARQDWLIEYIRYPWPSAKKKVSAMKLFLVCGDVPDYIFLA